MIQAPVLYQTHQDIQNKKSHYRVCWSYDIPACGDTVAIAESGNNRVLRWRRQ